MRPFDGKRILLGVTAGIAAYKAAWLARLLTQQGAKVDTVLTRAATEFIGTVTFEALTGRKAYTGVIAAGDGDALDHIRLAREADLVLVAPTTADFLARIAGGHADDLLSAVLLATRAPVLLVPAMNDYMWSHPQVQRNCDAARAIGYSVLEPDNGPLAVGEGSGPGRMPEPETIVEHVARMLEPASALSNLRVIVTAGPTREAIDPVRFISNRSSGRMGVEIAAAAARRHAEVLLIAGPLEVPVSPLVKVVDTESTAQMHDAVATHIADADVVIMAAAPSDFTAAHAADAKIKKSNAPRSIELALTADILRSTTELRKPGSLVVGFSLETGNMVTEAERKLRDKALDMIVANDATESGAGFNVPTNRVTIIRHNREPEALPLMSKREVAEAILDRVEAMLNER